MIKLTAKQKVILHEVLAKLNARRLQKARPPTTMDKIPECPGYPASYYLVDNYAVRRHWRRRPVRK